VRVAVVTAQFSETSIFKRFVKFNKNYVTLTVLIANGLVNSFIRRFRLKLVNSLCRPLSQQTSVHSLAFTTVALQHFPGFQRRTFPFLWSPELSPCLSYCNWSLAAFHSLQITTAHPNSCSRLHLLDWLASNQSQSRVTTDGQSASVFWVSRTHLGPIARFLLLSHSWWFVDVGRPL
jgi:hypothetical protein